MERYNKYTDDQLLSLLPNKDSKAFAELYNRHSERLIEIGYFFTHDNQAVEEIVNDIFMRLWKRPETFQIRSLEQYLNTAVKFGVFKSLARAKRRKILLERYPIARINHDDEQQLEARFLERFLNEVIDTLPEKSKAIYRYSREQDLSIDEISKQMHMKPKAVEYHITKSLKKLRDALQILNNISLLLAIGALPYFYLKFIF